MLHVGCETKCHDLPSPQDQIGCTVYHCSQLAVDLRMMRKAKLTGEVGFVHQAR